MYADHDANCLKSFDGINRGYDFFCGLEMPHEPFVGRNITCGNGVIGSRPRHPTIEKVIDLIAERWQRLGEKFRGKDDYSRIEIVMQRTYIALTLASRRQLNSEGNVDICFPLPIFFPKGELLLVYSKHFYANTWDEFKAKNPRRNKMRKNA